VSKKLYPDYLTYTVLGSFKRIAVSALVVALLSGNSAFAADEVIDFSITKKTLSAALVGNCRNKPIRKFSLKTQTLKICR
jgi:hypothetical protein